MKLKSDKHNRDVHSIAQLVEVEVILEAITKAGYKSGEDISICLDPATSEMWENGQYRFFKSDKKLISSAAMNDIWKNWINQYPIISLEDGMAENDWAGWAEHTKALGNKVELVGDALIPLSYRKQLPKRFVTLF